MAFCRSGIDWKQGSCLSLDPNATRFVSDNKRSERVRLLILNQKKIWPYGYLITDFQMIVYIKTLPSSRSEKCQPCRVPMPINL